MSESPPNDPIAVANADIPPAEKASPFAALRALTADDAHVRQLPPVEREPDVAPIDRAAMDAETAMAALESAAEAMFKAIGPMQAPATPADHDPQAAKPAPGNSQVVQTFVALTHRMEELGGKLEENAARLEL